MHNCALQTCAESPIFAARASRCVFVHCFWFHTILKNSACEAATSEACSLIAASSGSTNTAKIVRGNHKTSARHHLDGTQTKLPLQESLREANQWTGQDRTQTTQKVRESHAHKLESFDATLYWRKTAVDHTYLLRRAICPCQQRSKRNNSPHTTYNNIHVVMREMKRPHCLKKRLKRWLCKKFRPRDFQQLCPKRKVNCNGLLRVLP